MLRSEERSGAVRSQNRRRNAVSSTDTDGGVRVHAVATERHFVDHLAPVWALLPPEIRGKFWTGSLPVQPSGAYYRAEALGIAERTYGYPKRMRGLCLVAASGDLNRTVAASPQMRVVFFEHGCGISYNRVQNSYAGAPHRPNVDVFCFPNEISASKQRRTHPDRRIEVLGASPKMDAWFGRTWPTADKPVVALSFHADIQVVPETRSALYWYRKRLDEFLCDDWTLIGHAHPRLAEHAKVAYRQFDIPFVEDFNEIIETASCFVIDNSSTLFEFAATGRPVVALNCPRYRRNVHHGLRFWENIPGIQVESPDDARSGVAAALADAKELRKLREAAVDAVYPRFDGEAASRAAGLIVETLERITEKYPDVNDAAVSKISYRVVGSDGAEFGDFMVQGEARRLAAKRGGRVIVCSGGRPI
jgi:hypothetical protein